MRLFRAKFLATGAILASVVGAGAANLSTLSGSAFSEPSQILNTVNTLINNINAGVSGLVAQTQSPVGTQPIGSGNSSLGTEQTLTSLTIVGNQLTANGQALRAKCGGTFGANTNSKQIRLIFQQGVAGVAASATPNGALISSTASNINGGSWELEGILTFNTATTNTFIGRGTAQNNQSANPAVQTSLVSPIVSTSAVINFANAITVQCNGVTGAVNANAAGDISASELIVEQIK